MLTGQTLIDAITAGGPIEIEAEGPQMRLVARFSASVNARRAAALMRNARPQPQDDEIPQGAARRGG